MNHGEINIGDLVAVPPYTELRDMTGNSFVCEEEATAVVTSVFVNEIFQEIQMFCHGELFYLSDTSLADSYNLKRI